MTKRLWLVALALLSPTTGSAWEKQWEEPAVEDSCDTYDARYSEAPLFRIQATTKGAPVHLYSEKAACAANDTCAAREKIYLIEGDAVFGGPEDKGFRCVYYGTRKGGIVSGFVPTSNLAAYDESEPLTPAFLIGTWTYEGNPKIVITAAGQGRVKAKGEASWPGVGKDARHTGEFAAEAAIAGKEIKFRTGGDDYDCEVDMLRRGPYLVAVDNSYCGGLNVRFSSILVKLGKGK